MPRSGCRQRNSASAPTTASISRISGWKLNLELSFRISSGQFEVDRAMRLHLRAMHGQEKAARAAAVRFGRVQRKIGIGEQLIGGGAVIGRDRDAGAAADAHGMLVDLKILCEPVEHCVDNLADETRIAASGTTRTNSSPP